MRTFLHSRSSTRHDEESLHDTNQGESTAHQPPWQLKGTHIFVASCHTDVPPVEQMQRSKSRLSTPAQHQPPLFRNEAPKTELKRTEAHPLCPAFLRDPTIACLLTHHATANSGCLACSELPDFCSRISAARSATIIVAAPVCAPAHARNTTVKLCIPDAAHKVTTHATVSLVRRRHMQSPSC